MQPFCIEDFGNPGSTTHEYGRVAQNAVKQARAGIATAVGALRPSEVIFTSGATESNNIAIQGLVHNFVSNGKNHVISSQTEHKSVLGVLQALESDGIEVTYIKPDPDGWINPADVRQALTTRTALITIMHANNEIGAINDVKAIGEIAEEAGVLFHCDAAQSFGKLPIDVEEMGIHLLSISAHKIYGPKGVGALYIRKNRPEVKLTPILHGGGQERGLRPGTLASPLIVGLAEAGRIAIEHMAEDASRMRRLRDHLLKGLKDKCGDVVVNGGIKDRLPNNLNVSFLGVRSDTLMMNLWDDIAVSDGSACSSLDWTTSYVLRAMGLGLERSETAIRFGLGRFTTEEEIDFSIDCISAAVESVRSSEQQQCRSQASFQ